MEYILVPERVLCILRCSAGVVWKGRLCASIIMVDHLHIRMADSKDVEVIVRFNWAMAKVKLRLYCLLWLPAEPDTFPDQYLWWYTGDGSPQFKRRHAHGTSALLLKLLQVHSALSTDCWLAILQAGICNVIRHPTNGSYFVAEVLGCIAEAVAVAHSQHKCITS